MLYSQYEVFVPWFDFRLDISTLVLSLRTTLFHMSRGLFRCSFVVLRENKQTAKSSALMVTLIIKQVEWLSAPGCSNKGLYIFPPWLCMTNTKYFFVLFKTHILIFTINQSVFDILTLTTDCLFGRLLDPLFPAVYTEPCNGSIALLLSQYI